ncbi:MAG: LacI family DNA-binding transcriptional regulator [Deltaproteobacteria bacterium]|nr:LacI family DNA-binding transcriptional regulator [Deltaproteobacteria bacterium]
MKKRTMQEIARMAGFSLATVSRTIHSPHLVKPKTRERILRVMEENRYVYNATAGEFSKKRSNVIGIIIPTTRGAIFSNSTQAIAAKAREKGFSLIIGSTGYDRDVEHSLLLQFQERRLAGVVLTGFTLGQEKTIEDLLESGIPCVVVWETLDNPELSFVGFDNFKAAYSVTEYLIRLKHRRIGLIAGPFSKVGRVKKRLIGYRVALKDHDISFDPSLVIEKSPTLEDGKQAMVQLLSLPERPTAVFAASDMLALGAMAGAKERGLRIPDDISVAGFDDIDFAAYWDPPLTTVRVPASEMGEIAVTSLIKMIEGGAGVREQVSLDTQLVIRDSCREFTECRTK